jgi:hypothetical protein
MKRRYFEYTIDWTWWRFGGGWNYSDWDDGEYILDIGFDFGPFTLVWTWEYVPPNVTGVVHE